VVRKFEHRETAMGRFRNRFLSKAVCDSNLIDAYAQGWVICEWKFEKKLDKGGN
jgi:tellurite resistance protein